MIAMSSNNPFDPGYYCTEELRDFGFKSVGENVNIAKNMTVIGLSNISIGSNVRIDGYGVLAVHDGYLDIGNYVHIAGGAYVGCKGGVVFEDFSGVSQHVKIYSASDDYSGKSLTNPTIPEEFLNAAVAPVRLGRHAIIGSGSVILPGVEIGEGASVGALSLVTKQLDPWGVYFGSPAKRLKSRKKDLLVLEAQLMQSDVKK